MTNDQAAALLLRASGVDGRKAGELQARMWGHLLRDVDFDAAMEAVDLHYTSSEKWLMPVHVIAGAKRLHAERLGRAKRAEIDAVIAAENGGDSAPSPVMSGGPAVPLALTGPLHERLPEYRAGRQSAHAERLAREAAAAEQEAERETRRVKRAEILAELEAVREEAKADA